ncbi:MAG: hypothetical protein O7C59_07940 [Rickettsia endosymbiont of Ixodes persulcatus]|nr:hypothetical protein [Rickettsia endosymbiont of Ixodes persulcatus]
MHGSMFGVYLWVIELGLVFGGDAVEVVEWFDHGIIIGFVYCVFMV